MEKEIIITGEMILPYQKSVTKQNAGEAQKPNLTKSQLQTRNTI